jgi:hypothetical protein
MLVSLHLALGNNGILKYKISLEYKIVGVWGVSNLEKLISRNLENSADDRDTMHSADGYVTAQLLSA